jgi:hypothetical protein
MKMLVMEGAIAIAAALVMGAQASESRALMKPVDIMLDGRHLRLDVNPGKPALEEVVQFCHAHGLLPEHCNTLVDHVLALQSQNGGAPSSGSTDSSSGSEADQSRDVNKGLTGDSQDPEPLQDDQYYVAHASGSGSGFDEAAPLPASGRIDYSRREGPHLDVTMKDGASFDVLQTYAGESAQQACDRFCRKHSLLDDECAQLVARFMPMHGIQPVRADAGGWEAANPPKSGHAHDADADAAGTHQEDATAGWEERNLAFGLTNQFIINGVATLVVLAAFRVQWGEDAAAAQAALRGAERRVDDGRGENENGGDGAGW